MFIITSNVWYLKRLLKMVFLCVVSGEKVVNNLSRFVLIIWIFVVLILTQSYTASLASMLTVKRLRPSFDDVQEIRKQGYFVGYQNNSFVRDLLMKQLGFKEDKLKPYNTPEEYKVALSKGEVAAIFDEIPYIKLFLNTYCSNFTMTGPTYRTDGFGFVRFFIHYFITQYLWVLFMLLHSNIQFCILASYCIGNFLVQSLWNF